jgi:putative PIN family toxin of toxin-antitoxin system
MGPPVSNPRILRLVLDTDVMFAAFRSAHGASRRLLLHILDGRAHLLLSTAMLIEYEAVLTRPHVLRQLNASIADISTVLDGLIALSTQVRLDYRWRPVAADPDDDLVIETALNGGADVIASFNLADMRAGAARLGIPVERPADVLKRIAS